jgi:regulator of sirC expression with transglutaminase-like and TPR domain
VWSPTPSSTLEYFAMLVADPTDLPLLEAAASLALDEYPDLSIQMVPNAVDQLVGRLHRRLPADAAPIARVRALNHFFYNDLGFRGNLNNYYDPDNSYVHLVLSTRMGIPISLAVLWLELAHSLDLNAGGVSFPGHFLCKVSLSEGQVILDPFSGETLGREAVSERLQPFKRAHGLPEDDEAPLDLFLQPATASEILHRMLLNLREIHRSHDDAQRELAVHERLVILSPEAWELRRDRGLCAARLGDKRKAVRDLEVYLHHVQDAPDRAQVSAALSQLI